MNSQPLDASMAQESDLIDLVDEVTHAQMFVPVGMTASGVACYFSILKLIAENSGKCWFWTLTFKEKLPNHYASNMHRLLLNDIKNEIQAGRWPSSFGGVKVVEDHPGGHGIHFHWVIKPRIPIRDLLRIAKRWGFGRINVHSRPCSPKVASYLATYLGKGDSLPGLRKWGCIGDFIGSKTHDIEFGSKSVRAFRIAFRKLRQAGATRNQAFVGAKVAQRYFDHHGVFPETLNF